MPQDQHKRTICEIAKKMTIEKVRHYPDRIRIGDIHFWRTGDKLESEVTTGINIDPLIREAACRTAAKHFGLNPDKVCKPSDFKPRSNTPRRRRRSK